MNLEISQIAGKAVSCEFSEGIAVVVGFLGLRSLNCYVVLELSPPEHD